MSRLGAGFMSEEERRRLRARAVAMARGEYAPEPYRHDGPERVGRYGDAGWEDYPGGGDLDPTRRDGAVRWRQE